MAIPIDMQRDDRTKVSSSGLIDLQEVAVPNSDSIIDCCEAQLS